MLTNRKKLKNRNKKIKVAVLSVIFILLSSALLFYWIWANILSKVSYISPLASGVFATNSAMHEKKINELKNALKKENVEFVSINNSGGVYKINLKNNAEVIISQSKDLNEQISSLQFILHRLTMESRDFKKLDLQYDKPVIVF